MKKLVISFLMILSAVVIADAQNSAWERAVKQYLSDFGSHSKETTESFKQMGINATMTAEYDSAAKDLIMEVMFEPQVWSMLDNNALQAGKNGTLQSFQKSYKTNQDFRNFIVLMKHANAKIRVKYSCRQGGTVKTKDFIIYPEEIMK